MNSMILVLCICFSFCLNKEDKAVDQVSTVKTLSQEEAAIDSSEYAVISEDSSEAVEKDKSVPKTEEEFTEQVEQIDTRPIENDQLEDKPRPEEKEYQEDISQSGDEDVVISSIHESFDKLLKKYVSTDGRVNYKGFNSNIVELDSYLTSLKSQDPSSMSKDEELAYWINVYNAFTIKLILDNYPLKSIIDLDNGKVWDRKWIPIAGTSYSLNQVENEIIRPRFKEPRIHFAVNCAARSCPPLLNAAWTADNLESNLERQTRKFINNVSFNTISSSHIQVSKIFEWYAVDFGDLINYLNQYSKTKISSSARIEFLEYDWSLNE